MKRILIALMMFFVVAGGLAEAAPQVSPFIQITSPNGGEKFEVGSARKIAWKSEGVGSVILHLMDDTGWFAAHYIENGSGNPGSVYWVIPNFLKPGKYRIYITGCDRVTGCYWDDPRIASDASDGLFEIVVPPVPIVTIKASWYRSYPNAIQRIVDMMGSYMQEFNGPAEYRILMEPGFYNEGRVHLENSNLTGKTLKFECPLGAAVMHSSEQQTIDFRAQGANLSIFGCVVINDYIPDQNQDPATRWNNATIVAAFGPEEVKIQNTDIASTYTNGVSMNYVGKETLIHNEIYAARIAVSHSNMGEEFFRPRRVNRDNIIQGGLIAHFFRNTKVYPIPNDNYIYVAVGGATTSSSYVPGEIRAQFIGELW